MKKLVLLLVALASLSFAADEKKDCSQYLNKGDHKLEELSSSSGYMTAERKLQYSNEATAYYLRYQICKDLEKGK